MTTSSAETPAVEPTPANGSFVSMGGQDYYAIENFDAMRPFLMSIVSSDDHWMYLSSNGGLTAGRVSAQTSLFPYETVDQLHDCHHHTGPFTLIRCQVAGKPDVLWQPFRDDVAGQTVGTRRLLKHVAGDEVVFEEFHEQLGLKFQYRWRSSSKYGFIRTVEIENYGSEQRDFAVVDGLQNLLPHGVPLGTYQQASCLVDAYKHNECDPASGLGIFSLTSQILDRAEAAEALRATIVWQQADHDSEVFMLPEGIDVFRQGGIPEPQTQGHGRRGNYLTHRQRTLEPGESCRWHLVADVARDHQQVAEVRELLLSGNDVATKIEESITDDHRALMSNVASADGLQHTESQASTVHHFANVLFNNMRGGVFADNYRVLTEDFASFLKDRNAKVYQASQPFLRQLPSEMEYPELVQLAREQGSQDLLRLTMEYLPLTFGRRHGDPSRPWNVFEIKVRDHDGSQVYNYQGNWRDIFQNWEALCASYPAFLPSIVAKFVNASTVDGFNPYRITRDGIDWETPEPDDPWSNIGYWGDHQIVYLTKLLEAMHAYYPGEVERMLQEPMFCYARVPYRIKPFAEIAEDSSDTIEFDLFTEKEIEARVETVGADGKLVADAQGEIYYANLLEKLLVPVLSKLSNFVVGGGIWLNTQRPEWNDANNALVGAGLSMVTVCQLRRHLEFMKQIISGLSDTRVALSVEVEQWFRAIRRILSDNRPHLVNSDFDDRRRYQMLAEAGEAFSDYRLKVYENGFSGKHTVSGVELTELLSFAMDYLDHAIRENRRDDRLYNAYNLLELDTDQQSAKVSHLYEMLEGQVAVLSSGELDGGQVVELVHRMFESPLYRDDQQSFMLYPRRQLSGFLQRNQIPASSVQSVELLKSLVAAEEKTIVVQDILGDYHFSPGIERAVDLTNRLDELALDAGWEALVSQDRQHVLEVFEQVFSHKTYTGRSGTMYGYEGLGSIYWHMVSKLLLAVQENVFKVADRQSSKAEIEALTDTYYLVRRGLSSDKTPSQYGAFPTDPYSHSPSHSGAQQPGMTGQVKEEVLTRFGELGVRVSEGRIHFQPILLRRREFLQQASTFNYFDLNGQAQELEVPADSLAFTFCQTPVRYQLTDGPLTITLTLQNGAQQEYVEASLPTEQSAQIFGRTGQVALIDVQVPKSQVNRA